MSLLDMLGGVLSPQALNSATQSVSAQVGTTPEQTQHAIEAAVPLILSGLTRNAQTPEGEAALGNALAQHDGTALDNLGMGQLPSTQDGQNILGHVFGSQTPAAANAVAQRSGIDPQMAMQILSIVAPLVLGMLGRSQGGAGGALGGGLGSILGSVLGGSASQSGGLGSILGGLLGGAPAQGQSQAQSGGLGNILGGLLGGAQPQTQAQPQAQSGGLGNIMGTLNNVLDNNGNGNALDDLVGMLGGRR
ncbi:DUF937 domain-containing protein [Deinococcus sp. KNUC1210]|uniref:DUF937 domain-containing protein n=1 Tax=Deinococcus sp. KNUC1210 TaxID=2917691 RepID=UPI001EF15C0B|nr:DUF937 domain-containing protein [Deinococcus sp. KNUC1210]ULH15217.1 DUF937 domain-containing protein [Deinococcus sp. KNUC1210]